MKLQKKLRILFTKSELIRITYLFIGILVAALLEVIGVASVFPFVAVVTSPELIHNNIYLNTVYSFFDFQTDKSFIVFLGIIVIIVIFVSNCYQAFITWAMAYFSALQNHRVEVSLLEHYLKQPYNFFLIRNTSELEKNIHSEVARGISGVLVPFLTVLSKMLVILLMFLMILYVDFQMAMILSFTLIGAYWLIFRIIKNRVGNIGLETTNESFNKFKAADEALSGVKDIILSSNYADFVNKFFSPSKKLAIYGAQSSMYMVLPRYLLEIVAFGGIVSIIISLVATTKNGDTSAIIPVISLYVMSGYRLMPALQQTYASIVKVKYNIHAFETIINEFSISSDDRVEKNDTTFLFEDKLQVNDVSFSYDNTDNKVLNKLNLTIYPNTIVGIVGLTGSGKTTLIDIILGLLNPLSGSISLDGIKLNNQNISSWQKLIGYVPQSIYLIDDTIEANIAFPILNYEGAINKAKEAAKLANLHEFIMTLPEQYETIVGERGVRLSGGQRQRIGIARSLYHNPKVLVFDEATSSLDGITENAIMEAILNLSNKKTIIMIAHRLSTVKECDTIHLMSGGKIVDSGSYKDLVSNNEEFKEMTKHL
jgi:ATP-binding cassette, subfamily B, bacterial PglK